MSAPTPTNLMEAETEIDLRIAELWSVVMGAEGMDMQLIGALLRAAFCQGYIDCYREPVRGTLLRRHGFTLPPRAAKTEH
jgi:hypothetical protein